jgi:hypothetical protein
MENEMNKFNWYDAPKQQFLTKPAVGKKRIALYLALTVGALCLPLIASVFKELTR